MVHVQDSRLSRYGVVSKVVVQLGMSVYKVLPVSVGKGALGVMVSTSVRMLISWELMHT